MEDKPNYYAIIPAEVRYNPNINANEKLLYGEISALSNKYGYCIATNEYFALLYNVSTRTITDWIKALEDMTYLSSEIEVKRYDDGTIKKIRKLYINHIENSQHDHIEVSRNNHIEENFSYNNTSNINNINKKEIYKEKRFKKPTLEEVKQYCEERGNNINAEVFIDFYEANGWVQGKNKPLKDWKAAVRTWENNKHKRQDDGQSTLDRFDADSKVQDMTKEEQDNLERMLSELQYNI